MYIQSILNTCSIKKQNNNNKKQLKIWAQYFLQGQKKADNSFVAKHLSTARDTGGAT